MGWIAEECEEERRQAIIAIARFLRSLCACGGSGIWAKGSCWIKNIGTKRESAYLIQPCPQCKGDE